MSNTGRNELAMERSLSCACPAIFDPDSGEGSGGQTCSKCAPFTLLIATFSRRRLENLLRASGKSRQCLDNLQTTTLWFPSPPASRYPGRTMLDYWRCVI